MRTGEMLFHAGAAIMAVSLLLGILALPLWKIKGARLEKTLSEEYGQRPKRREPFRLRRRKDKG